jgi:hypothetical protein
MADFDEAFLMPMQQAAIQLHELFLHLIEAGFEEEQALRIVIAIAVKEAA